MRPKRRSDRYQMMRSRIVARGADKEDEVAA